jgi:hypothetical protein
MSTLCRDWFPQRMPVMQRGELLSINVERLVHWHDGRKIGSSSMGEVIRTNMSTMSSDHHNMIILKHDEIETR